MVWHLISHIFSSCLESIQDAAAFPLDALAAIHKCDADTKAVFQAGPGHGHGIFSTQCWGDCGSRTIFLQAPVRSLLTMFF